ncbi:GNAT family N-acetyltransferase [Glaciihabitans arcticus]|uniref:GNAT family N-acetyltransferase n=1 Tax=Glaciihabitans arcticus TaxID=2668039 RepID=A0A4Q9GM36_9MICO|nr:GNAT family N-acetyltransferase [Glaciihabitans arcticus]TBN55499.1 GNAT family N-acetyltransferase [Glaciihabitans arcticus]
MTTIIRRAIRDDAALLHALAVATFALACPPGTTPEAIADFIGTHLSEARFGDYLADPARDLFIGEVDGTPAGYTMLVFAEPSDPDVASVVTVRPTAELSKVYVLEGFHGSGLARELVGATVDAARERGAASVWLGVNELNPNANRFYEKQGFERVGTKKFLVGERWEDDFVRTLEL